MQEYIKNDILSRLHKAISILQKGEDISNDLSELSNDTIHIIGVYQDASTVHIAIIFYSLSKIYARKEGKISGIILQLLKKAEKSLLANNEIKYNKLIEKLLHEITRIDKEMKMYVEQVIDQAGIKKGSKLYDLGISLAQSSSILGITQWELYRYAGKTQMSDFEHWKVPARQRITVARRIFSL